MYTDLARRCGLPIWLAAALFVVVCGRMRDGSLPIRLAAVFWLLEGGGCVSSVDEAKIVAFMLLVEYWNNVSFSYRPWQG